MAAAAEPAPRDSVDLGEAVSRIYEATESAAPATPEVRPSPEGRPMAEPSAHEAVPPVAADPSASVPGGPPTPAVVEEGSPSEVLEGDEGGAPSFWSDEDRAAWAKVPAELRPLLAKYERQRLDETAEQTRRAGAERDEAVRAARHANAVVEQAALWWRQHGPAFRQAFVDRWSGVDWKALAEKDPAEAARLMAQRQQEEGLLAEAGRRRDADLAAARAQAEQAFAEARRTEQARLAERLPEFFAGDKAGKTFDELRRYLHAKGVPVDRIDAIYEAPIIEIALNAMRFENARKALRRATGAKQGIPPNSSATPTATPPARVPPGPASPSPSTDRAADTVRAVGDRFRQSGGASLADAAELIRLSGL